VGIARDTFATIGPPVDTSDCIQSILPSAAVRYKLMGIPFSFPYIFARLVPTLRGAPCPGQDRLKTAYGPTTPVKLGGTVFPDQTASPLEPPEKRGEFCQFPCLPCGKLLDIFFHPASLFCLFVLILERPRLHRYSVDLRPQVGFHFDYLETVTEHP